MGAAVSHHIRELINQNYFAYPTDVYAWCKFQSAYLIPWCCIFDTQQCKWWPSVSSY